MLTKTIWISTCLEKLHCKALKSATLTIATCTLFLGGCGNLPAGEADDYLQPSAPEAKVSHELHFDVRSDLKAVISLSETQIMARVNQGKAVNIRRVNLPLLREWGERYLQIGDYDQDGLLDLAILSNAGRGGKHMCYAVYRYNPVTGQFRQRKSFDRCYG